METLLPYRACSVDALGGSDNQTPYARTARVILRALDGERDGEKRTIRIATEEAFGAFTRPDGARSRDRETSAKSARLAGPGGRHGYALLLFPSEVLLQERGDARR